MGRQRASLLLALLSVCIVSSVVAFAPCSVDGCRSSTSLNGAVGKARPKLNKETGKFEPSLVDDGEYPYDAVGSLLRHGPNPFLKRVTNPNEYEQFVLSYMDSAGVDRSEATGNVDAKLNNEMDWIFQKLEEKKGRPKVDYTVLKKKDAILTIIWAFGITPLALNVIYETVTRWGSGISPDAYGAR